MNDDVAGVDQHPVASRHALDLRRRFAGLLQGLDETVRDSAYVTVDRARSDDHGVGQRSLSDEVDDRDVLGLHVLEDLERKGYAGRGRMIGCGGRRQRLGACFAEVLTGQSRVLT